MKTFLVQGLFLPAQDYRIYPKRIAEYRQYFNRRKNLLPNTDIGIDGIYSYDDTFWKKEEPDFFKEHKAILTQWPGAGYFAWKSRIVLNAFSKLEEGDILFYYDCNWWDGGTVEEAEKELPKILPRLISYVNKTGSLFHRMGLLERAYTKGDAFKIMGCLDRDKYWDTEQLQATWFFLKKNKANVRLMKQWSEYMTDSRCSTDQESEYPNHEEFCAHRWDQSVLSLLVKKSNIPIYSATKRFWDVYFKNEELFAVQ